MLVDTGFQYSDRGVIDIACLCVRVFDVHVPSELIIRLVSARQPEGSWVYQLRCRHGAKRGEGRYWIRPVDEAGVGQALDELARSTVPVVPVYTGADGGCETSLTISYICHPVSYSWGWEPPSGYEALVRFANRLERWSDVREVLGYRHELPVYLTTEVLQGLAGRKIFARGFQYYAAGKVRRLHEVDEELRATIEGTESYEARLWVEDGELSYRCACPMGARALCCKHVVATGLAWIGEM